MEKTLFTRLATLFVALTLSLFCVACGAASQPLAPSPDIPTPDPVDPLGYPVDLDALDGTPERGIVTPDGEILPPAGKEYYSVNYLLYHDGYVYELREFDRFDVAPIGDHLTLVSPTVRGFRPDQEQVELDITKDSEPAFVKYYPDPEQLIGYPVDLDKSVGGWRKVVTQTLRHIDADTGEELFPTYQYEIWEGSQYSVAATPLAGYSVTPSDYDEVVGTEDFETVFYYSRTAPVG